MFRWVHTFLIPTLWLLQDLWPQHSMHCKGRDSSVHGTVGGLIHSRLSWLHPELLSWAVGCLLTWACVDVSCAPAVCVMHLHRCLQAMTTLAQSAVMAA